MLMCFYRSLPDRVRNLCFDTIYHDPTYGREYQRADMLEYTHCVAFWSTRMLLEWRANPIV